MPFIIPANTLASGGYEVANSLRFGVNTYMHKVLGSDNEKDTWTFSLWVKRGNIGSVQRMMTHNGSTSGKFFYLRWEANEQLHFHIGMSDGNFAGFDTTQVFRDRSAWYHIVCAVDTTQATESNRVKIYVNGSQVTAFGTANYPARNVTALLGNTATPMVVGTLYGSGFGISSGSPQEFYDGYLAEVCFIDDLQLAADSFGEFDEDSGIWKAIDVSGLTFGTDGFYLDFKASGNLGNDANGGTDLTEVNLAATDQTTDTPTNNFCTWNPLVVRGGSDDLVYIEGNTGVSSNQHATNNYTFGTQGFANGKWYWEAECETVGGEMHIGIVDSGSSTTGYPSTQRNYRNNGNKETNTGSAASFGDTYTDGDIIGVAVDLDNDSIYFAKNGTWQDSGDPTSGASKTGAAFTDITSALFANFVLPWVSLVGVNGGADSKCFANFGNPAFTISSGNADGNGYGNFEYAVPSGYFALNTKNLAEYG